jgi:hypothetical protein
VAIWRITVESVDVKLKGHMEFESEEDLQKFAQAMFPYGTVYASVALPD